MLRVKHLWNYVPLPAKLKLMWERISLNHITLIYFAFSIIHCFLQVGLQLQAFSVNQQAAKLLNSVVIQGNAKLQGFPVLGDDLRVCEDVPKKLDAETCQVVWSGTPFNRSALTGSSTSGSAGGYTTESSYVIVPSATQSTTSLVSSTVRPSAAATSTVTELVLRPSEAVVQVAVTSSVPTSTITVFVVPTAAPNSLRIPAKRMEDFNALKLNAVNTEGEQSVTLDGIGHDDENIVLSRKCILSLNWPVMKLNNTKREDITFVMFQFWVLGMSIVALLNESIPHTLASLVTHILATAWTGFQIVHTNNFRGDFNRLTTNGACGQNFLLAYWKARSAAEIPSLALNIVALFVSAFLSWKIIKLFGWQTFKRVGASLTIKRVYTYVLVLSINIQLALFFIVTSFGIWIDQLCNGPIGRMARHPMLYRTLIIVACIGLVPWLTLGWFAVRREHRHAMHAFLFLSALYLACWGAMFDATTFRWTFVEWRFFSIITSASALLTLCALILGVVCRLNFGKGLPQHLAAEEQPPGDDFEPMIKPEVIVDVEKASYYEEKVDFPPTHAPIPTWHTAYGNDSPPEFAPSYTPPRLVSPSDSQPSTQFPSPAETVAPRLPSLAHTRAPTLGSPQDAAPLGRHGSIASQHSTRSGHSSNESASFSRSKRWVIE